ncbi:EamA family transporter RarD [Streptococcaceae bacterium ESL0729]|nr:EamA family transporter RarD [Streptococcaceae bacterium ESL0729]
MSSNKELQEKNVNKENYSKKDLGILLAVICHVSWGLLSLFWKLLGNINSLDVFSYRIISTLVSMSLYFFISGGLKRLKHELWTLFANKKQLVIMFCASIFIAINWLIYIYAVASNQASAASLGYYINPLISVLLALIFFKESLSRYTKFSIFLALGGVLLLTIQNGSLPLISIILPLSFAFYGLAKKFTNLSSDVSMFVESLFLSPLVITYLLFFSKSNPLNYTSLEITCLALSGVITAIPLLLFSQAVKLAPFNIIGFIQYLSPTIQLLIALFVFKEPLKPGDLHGFILIWLSILIFSYGQVRDMRKLRLKD